MTEHATMPRAVVTALVAAAFLALLALADVAVWLVAATPSPLRIPGGVDAWWVGAALYLFVGVRRRDPRVRMPVYWWALATAILLGTLGGPLLLTLGLLHRSVLPFLAVVLLVATHAAIAYALSRPSAKAWFAPAPTA